MAFDREKYLRLFFDEADELMSRLGKLLVELEADLTNRGVVNEIFRITHTIKGNAAAMGFELISSFAHKIEDLFALVRDGKLEFTSAVADVAFEALGELERLLEELREKGVEPAELPEVAAAVDRVISGDLAGLEAHRRRSAAEIKLAETVRVPLQKLDYILNLVGEMIVGLSRLEGINERLDDRELGDAITKLRRIADEFQYVVMDIRLVPLSSIFDQLPRLVRDLAAEAGKKAKVSVYGSDIQLDSKVVERIKTPIIQIIRNAISHGIEPPDERVRAGKDEAGSISVTASRQRNRVLVRISDDGRGIDLQKVAQTAVELGIVSRERVSEMSEQEVLELVFEPGFTTAGAVDRMAGRGVGMDAVRAELASIGGAVSVHSVLGVGTTFTIDVPISVAVVKALLCRVAGRILAIPVSSVVSVRQVQPQDVKAVGGEKSFTFLDEPVPLVELSELLYDLPPGRGDECIRVVVVDFAGRRVGFAVDEFIREEDIVAKPLSVPGEVRVVSGAAVLGDGSVALILDVGETIRKASLRKVG